MTPPPLPPSDQPGRLNWFDEQFSQIGWPMLIALMVLFTVLMMIFSGVGVLKTRNPVAHHRAKVIFIASSVYVFCCGVIAYVVSRNPGALN